jgi:hypothetical protein
MQKQLRTPTNPASMRAAGIDLSDRPDKEAEYQRFCDDLKRNLPPVEAEVNGTPTFAEWLEAQDA